MQSVSPSWDIFSVIPLKPEKAAFFTKQPFLEKEEKMKKLIFLYVNKVIATNVPYYG